MSNQAETTLLGRAFDWLKGHLGRSEELDSLSREDMEFLAADLGLTPAQFRDLAPRVVDHSAQMDQMMRTRGLDPDLVRLTFARLIRDMEIVCAQCRSVGRCRRELAHGTAAETMSAFCLNAEAIDDLASGVS